MPRRRPPGSPWQAARARVWFENGMWHYTVTNWWGNVVAHDYAGGGHKGREVIFTAAAKMVVAVRLMDGVGQGKHLKNIHVRPAVVRGSGAAARDTWPERFPTRRGYKYAGRARVITL